MKVKFNQFKTKSTQSSDSKGSNSMKKNRKLTALLVAACMTLPMAATTFTVPMVASAGSITITNHTNKNDDAANNMTAYQVFTGNYSAGILSITGWGEDFNAVEFIGFLQEDAIFAGAFDGIAEQKTEATAQQVATVIATYKGSENEAKAEAVAKYAVECKGGSGIQAESSGEDYVISNLDDGYYVVVDSSAGIDDALTLGLLQVAGPDGATVTPKRVVPTVTKTAKDSKDGADYDSVVDCYKGEEVDFKVEVAVPDLSRYNDYYLEIEDTLGTDFESLSGVTLKDGSSNPIAGGNANCSITTENNKITIKIENAKTYSGQTLSLEYSATLKATATTGENAFDADDNTQKNSVIVKYLNDPNNAWEPKNESSLETPDPGLLSSTTDAVVKAYTYQLTIDKIEKDNSEKKLEGAKFKLRNSSNGYVKKSAETGDYTISWGTKEDASVFETDENGAISIVGLDAGTYYLEETEAPSGGYNRLTDPIMVTITPTYDGTSKTLTNLSGTVGDEEATANIAEGEIKVQIANNKGATLPSTGGIGTKIFYILGGTLVIGSGAALVIKKRMSKDEE